MRPNSKAPGLVLTRHFTADERQLLFNAVVNGRTTAVLRTGGNKPMAGFTFAESVPVTQSGFSQAVGWKTGGLDRAPAGLVRILFRLEDAAQFSFDFRRPPQ